jgi:ankyrin repeat protein
VAAHNGELEAVKLLVEHGADINARTFHKLPGWGPSPLNLALLKHGPEHSVSKYLMSIGALNHGTTVRISKMENDERDDWDEECDEEDNEGISNSKEVVD